MWKIYNPELYGLYLLQKEELQNGNMLEVKEINLYHSTSRSNADMIARNNIDWRMTRRSRFGVGACFSLYPKYAHTYASSNGGKYINILIF